MYRDQYHPKVKKDLKKLDKRLRSEIETVHIPAILEQPEHGEELVGDLSGMRAYHFNYQKQAYRIAYAVDETARISVPEGRYVCSPGCQPWGWESPHTLRG